MILVFSLATLIQLVVWRLVFSRAFASPPTRPGGEEAVSVIVCFCNEAPTLARCLRSVLQQDYPHFEVVAVDDNSTDGSVDIVTRLQAEYPHLRLVRPGPTRPGKKDALTAGIAAARHGTLLLTDADCVPASPHWLSLMTAPLRHGYEVVLGCSPYAYRPAPLNVWQRFEATYTALQYQGFAARGLPYMGVGRNLAYRKSFFTRAGGLVGHAHLPGGDDDLLINQNALPERTSRVTDPAAWTVSAPTLGWRDYLRQKLRHQSVGKQYRPAHQLLLALLALSHGLFYLLGLLLLFTPFWPWVLYSYFVRAVAVYAVFSTPVVGRFLGGYPRLSRGRREEVEVPYLAGMGTVGLLLSDALLAPYYGFLAVATGLPARRW